MKVITVLMLMRLINVDGLMCRAKSVATLRKKGTFLSPKGLKAHPLDDSDQCLPKFSSPEHNHSSSLLQDNVNDDYPVRILEETRDYLVVSKPPGVVCHHSDWTGSRARRERPMLQRVSSQINQRVNLVHRLDRGCSGCLLFAKAKTEEHDETTRHLTDAMRQANKTYLALVRGEGILNGEDLKRKGWFQINRPIKNARGVSHNASTWFCFIAGQDNAAGTQPDRARASLVLARPDTGRWHQIRRHLNGLSHPILGDSSHGNSRINREWRARRGLQPERTCLHLLSIRMKPFGYPKNGMDVVCPLAPDMMKLMQDHLPEVLLDSRRILRENHGIYI